AAGTAAHGPTWGEAVVSLSEWEQSAGATRVQRLAGGRLIVPTTLPVTSDGQPMERAAAACFLSDDAGKTWRRGQGLVEPPAGSMSGLEAPAGVEFADNHLLMLAGSDMGVLLRAVSADGGETWSVAESTALAAAAGSIHLVRLDAAGTLLLLW